MVVESNVSDFQGAAEEGIECGEVRTESGGEEGWPWCVRERVAREKEERGVDCVGPGRAGQERWDGDWEQRGRKRCKPPGDCLRE